MQGRLETDLKYQKATTQLLNNLPYCVTDWYHHMQTSNKASSSCYDFVLKISKFLSYINDDTKNIELDEITEQACESYMIVCQTKKDINGMITETTSSYRYTIWCALNSFIKFLYANEYISSDYMKNIMKPIREHNSKTSNRIKITVKDFNKIINSIKDGTNNKNKNRDMTIVLLFMTTGMKKTALSEINVSDINFENKTLQITDRINKNQTLILNDSVIKYLELWLEDRKLLVADKSCDALFINKDGDRMAAHGIYEIVKKYCKKGTGKKISPDQLRAGFCNILYKKTHDIEFVRQTIGHSNLYTTKNLVQTQELSKTKASRIMNNLLDI